MRKRTPLEIIAEILSLCRQPKGKTRLIRGVNLPWRNVNQYLDMMQSHGLLEIHNSPTKYLTTPKGHTFLKKWKEMAEITMYIQGKSGDSRTWNAHI